MQTRARRKDLDCAKGLGILLVVLGHLVPASSPMPTGNMWYFYLREVLYEFHMPFFMFLSGYVTFLSGAAYTTLEKWPTLVRKRAARLLLPFLIFGLFIAVGKWAASQLIHVDNLPSSISEAMMGLVWNTDYSPATSVWYIAVLFVLCIITPLLLRLTANRVWLLLLFALALYFAPIPHVLYLNRVATYYVFFVIGGLCSVHEAGWLKQIDRHAYALLAVFLATVIFFTLPQSQALGWHGKMLIAGVLSMPALHGVVRRRPLRDSNTLLQVGLFSFVIYLLNTPCIGVVKGVLFKLLPWDGYNFLLYAPLMMLGGTLGPILIKRYLFRPVPALDKITD